MEAEKKTLGLSRWQKVALVQLGGFSTQKLLKLTYLSTGLWLWKRLHSSEPRKDEKEKGCISLPGAHQIMVANSHTHQSPRQTVRVLSTLLRVHIFLFSLHSLLYSKATQDLDHNVSEPWSLCLALDKHYIWGAENNNNKKKSSKKF